MAASPSPRTRTTVAAKATMAVTGIVLLLFVLGHMAGNLQVFLGPEAMNSYAEFLHQFGHGLALWVVRAVLLACLVLHVASAAYVVRVSKAARPVAYAVKKDVATDFAARTMWMTGLIVLAFVVYHLLHFTIDPLGHYHDFVDAEGRHDVHRMVVTAFQNLPTVAVYVVAQVLLAMHISHGGSSLFQTLGWRTPCNARWVDRIGPTLAAIVLVGNLFIPLGVFAGLAS